MDLYQRLVERALFPLVLWKRGHTAQLRWQREFERTQYLSAEELRRLQTGRLRALVRHAWERCPFYRERFQQAGLMPDDIRELEDLRSIPPLEKAEIQTEASRMVAESWPGKDLLRNQTGGSTGQPVVFYLSGDRLCSRAAATLRHNAWAGWRVGDRTAVLWGAPADRPDRSWAGWLRQLLLREPIWLDTGALTEADLDQFARTLGRYRPRILQAYARSAVLFARWLEATGRRVPSPRTLVTSAEVLEDEDRDLLQRVLGCPVFNRYGCREVSVIASECPAHQGLHTMAEGLYLEIETPAGPARAGEVGAVLVTDLLNYAMPLIRYRIGDMASWAPGACPCGRELPRLERVAGRVTDFLVGVEGQLVSGVFLATYVVAQRPSLGQVQIVQDRAGAVTYRLRPGAGFRADEDGAYLRQATQRYLGATARVELEVVEELTAAPSGKILFSRSSVTPALLRTSGRPAVT